jgi:hypothetical protein
MFDLGTVLQEGREISSEEFETIEVYGSWDIEEITLEEVTQIISLR